MSGASPVLQVADLTFGYSSANVIHDLSFEIADGEMVALLGANGAGKSTTLRVLMGLSRGATGSVAVAAEPILGWGPERIARGYISLVPEGRRLFSDQSVEANLLLGAFHLRKNQARVKALLGEVYELFPKLHGYRDKRSDGLSGGEQQMVAIGRALMADPKVLMLDEPSLGLAPQVIESVFQALHSLKQRDRVVLLVEQRVEEALELVDRAYVLERGRIAMQGVGSELLSSPELVNAYLGEQVREAAQ
jgi:branched-chain amino acid transport system ATP-binding protein